MMRLVLPLLLVVLGAGAATAADAPAPRPATVVAVFPLLATAPDPALAWVGVVLQDTLTWDLRRVPAVDALDVGQLTEKAGMPADRLAALAPADAAATARALGARLVVAGRYAALGPDVVVELVVRDAASGAELDHATVSARPDGLVAAATAVIPRLLKTAGQAPRTPPARRAVAVPALAARGEGLAALTAAAIGGAEPALTAAVAALERATQADPRDGEAWYRLGEALERSARYDDARPPLARAIALAQGERDTVLEALALAETAYVDFLQGRPAAVLEPSFTRVLALSRKRAFRRGEALGLRGLGLTRFRQGRFADAIALDEQARAAWRALGNEGREAGGTRCVRRPRTF